MREYVKVSKIDPQGFVISFNYVMSTNLKEISIFFEITDYSDYPNSMSIETSNFNYLFEQF